MIAAPISSSGTFRIGDRVVHRLGFGAMRITGAGIWGPPRDRDAALGVLRRAVELGVDFIDTADAYGPEVSEQLIAEALSPYRRELLVATKFGLMRPGPDRWTVNGHPTYLRTCAEASLRRLKLDVIDLMQLHRIDPKIPIADQLGVLADLIAEGKVRYAGLSEVSVAQLAQARTIVPIATVQNLYNLERRKSDDVLAYCEQHGVGFIPWFPIGDGSLAHAGGPVAKVAAELGATPAQIALAWLLRRSPVMMPIPGTSSLAHLEENCAAAAVRLSDEQYASLERLA